MDSRFAGKLIQQYSQNNHMVGLAEMYGIELEAEDCPPNRMTQALRMVAPLYGVKQDGSLRNNGVEFVSVPLLAEDVPMAVARLYTTREYWSPSPRSGIHVHVNVQHWTMGQLRNMLASYAFVEPFVYKRCGEEREENVFCIPWYRAPDEAERMADMFNRGDSVFLRTSCKYSALYCGPIRSYGSIEFRHARTFSREEELLAWWKLVKRISDTHTGPDPVELYSRYDAAVVVRSIVGDLVSDMSNDAINAIAHDTGAVDTALLFAAPTYRFGEWGEPGRFDVAAQLPEQEDEEPVVQPATLQDLLHRDAEPQLIRPMRATPMDAMMFFDDPPPMPEDEDEEYEDEETNEEDL